MALRLVVDAGVLVAALLRTKGRARLAHPEHELFMTEQVQSEVRHELPRRIALLSQMAGLTDEERWLLATQCFAAIETTIAVAPEATYLAAEAEARWRIARAQNDWSSVALALILEAGIWTEDRDYFGCGLATWTTDTLTRFLEVLDSGINISD